MFLSNEVGLGPGDFVHTGDWEGGRSRQVCLVVEDFLVFRTPQKPPQQPWRLLVALKVLVRAPTKSPSTTRALIFRGGSWTALTLAFIRG